MLGKVCLIFHSFIMTHLCDEQDVGPFHRRACLVESENSMRESTAHESKRCSSPKSADGLGQLFGHCEGKVESDKIEPVILDQPFQVQSFQSTSSLHWSGVSSQEGNTQLPWGVLPSGPPASNPKALHLGAGEWLQL